MSITANQDYVFYENGLMMSSKQPGKRADACTVSTKNYVFLIPKKTTGSFILFDIIKTHALFEGVTIEEGLKNIIEKSETANDLEKSLIALLQNDEKYVHQINTYKKFKFSKFLGQQTLLMKNALTNHTSIVIKAKKGGNDFRAFHGQ